MVLATTTTPAQAAPQIVQTDFSNKQNLKGNPIGTNLETPLIDSPSLTPSPVSFSSGNTITAQKTLAAIPPELTASVLNTEEPNTQIASVRDIVEPNQERDDRYLSNSEIGRAYLEGQENGDMSQVQTLLAEKIAKKLDLDEMPLASIRVGDIRPNLYPVAPNPSNPIGLGFTTYIQIGDSPEIPWHYNTFNRHGLGRIPLKKDVERYYARLTTPSSETVTAFTNNNAQIQPEIIGNNTLQARRLAALNDR